MIASNVASLSRLPHLVDVGAVPSFVAEIVVRYLIYKHSAFRCCRTLRTVVVVARSQCKYGNDRENVSYEQFFHYVYFK